MRPRIRMVFGVLLFIPTFTLWYATYYPMFAKMGGNRRPLETISLGNKDTPVQEAIPQDLKSTTTPGSSASPSTAPQAKTTTTTTTTPKPASQNTTHPNTSVVARNITYPPWVPLNDSDTTALLTLFTTFSPKKFKRNIHMNVIRNWAKFIPEVIPVLYNTSTDPELIAFALKHNWQILQVPRLSEYGVPFLVDMYFDVKKRFNTTFYGFTNGDILFQQGLTDTLNFFKTSSLRPCQMLIVGLRKNFNIRNRTIFEFEDVSRISKVEAKNFIYIAQDYFFISQAGFAWDKVPDIVIGRQAYDNFLVGLARIQKVALVDASKSITALHQTGKDGNFAGLAAKGGNWNFKVIGKFPFGAGDTSQAEYKTCYDADGTVSFFRKPDKPKCKTFQNLTEIQIKGH